MEPDLDPFLLSFARVVRRRRRLLGMSQEEVASEAGLSARYVSLLETCKHQPSLMTMKAIADVLDTSLATLIAEAERDL